MLLVDNREPELDARVRDDRRRQLFEHSGPALALFRRSSTMKQFLLDVVFLDVLAVPWGLATSRTVGAVAVALGLLLAQLIDWGW